tara:strand:- start:227 stop:619 length:393 start_codon:yes stop_codon:yes gene_type:complete
MSFLEAAIAAIIGSAVTALAVALKATLAGRALIANGDLVKKAFDLIDPVLDKNIQSWNGSQVEKAFELSVDAVSDGKLSQEEIKKIAKHMSDAWKPTVAAEKVRQLENTIFPPELKRKVSIIVKGVLDNA